MAFLKIVGNLYEKNLINRLEDLKKNKPYSFDVREILGGIYGEDICFDKIQQLSNENINIYLIENNHDPTIRKISITGGLGVGDIFYNFYSLVWFRENKINLKNYRSFRIEEQSFVNILTKIFPDFSNECFYTFKIKLKPHYTEEIENVGINFKIYGIETNEQKEYLKNIMMMMDILNV